MRKAMRLLEEKVDLADAVLWVVDARVVNSSRHPFLEQSLRQKGKSLVLVLNKADLAEEPVTRAWLRRLRDEGLLAAALASTQGRGPGPLAGILEEVRRRVQAARHKQRLLPRDPRLVVAGIPNVGKSSLLNRLVGRGRARTGARPGLTRGQQWVRLPGKWEVLDTPGILYPRIEGEQHLAALAAAGNLPLEVIPVERAAGQLLARLRQLGRLGELVSDRESPPPPEADPAELLARCGGRRGFLLPGGEVDLVRTSRWLLGGFARGSLGAVSLERPDDPWPVREAAHHEPVDP
jgi:ribosome biogenesis GTPase A